nr:MAG TPA: hypothetical protein [Bacteriophage sp.]
MRVAKYMPYIMADTTKPRPKKRSWLYDCLLFNNRSNRGFRIEFF